MSRITSTQAAAMFARVGDTPSHVSWGKEKGTRQHWNWHDGEWVEADSVPFNPGEDVSNVFLDLDSDMSAAVEGVYGFQIAGNDPTKLKAIRDKFETWLKTHPNTASSTMQFMQSLGWQQVGFKKYGDTPSRKRRGDGDRGGAF